MQANIYNPCHHTPGSEYNLYRNNWHVLFHQIYAGVDISQYNQSCISKELGGHALAYRMASHKMSSVYCATGYPGQIDIYHCMPSQKLAMVHTKNIRIGIENPR